MMPVEIVGSLIGGTPLLAQRISWLNESRSYPILQLLAFPHWLPPLPTSL